MRRALAVAALLVTLAGCGGGTGGKPATGGAHTGTATDTLSACDDLVSKPAAELVNGCTDPSGDLNATVTYQCGGTDFYAAGTETRMWWAKKTGTVQAGTDDEYNAAYGECVTGK